MSQYLNNVLEVIKILKQIQSTANNHKAPFYSEYPGDTILKLLGNLEQLDFARASYYTDQESQKVFDWVLQYKMIMSFYGMPIPVELPNTPYPQTKWLKLIDEAKAFVKNNHVIQNATDDFLDIIDTWILESYALSGICEAKTGDIVFDCGTFTGNTSLYFSQKVGDSGHVYGFEAGPSTFKTYKHNTQSVKNLTQINAAVSDQCGEMFFANDGCAGGGLNKDGQISVKTINLDTFYQENNLSRVDFIKMDIEGAEEAALIGAETIIKKHKPQMAISAYHKDTDLTDLPKRILTICPDYSFQLRHFSNCVYETVLFCIPQTANKRSQSNQNQSNCQNNANNNEQYKTVLLTLMPLLHSALSIFYEQKREQETNLLFNKAYQLLQISENTLNQVKAENQKLSVENFALKNILKKKG
ncbi:FkbM family methyltransferase [Desulfovibrio litoralis]|uniref:Methyltransferase, FkbM family n=1 Tax=Desulfovibrio litoralis DSM 11393 TaxID=1121455 RepID=A0A1M7TD60_9BACT|nr:FkbM family methyltransferase [Desulfovibrio litoralis]SHN68598.1 methyltransferase, FkbM family [Desulfovibrio litoralis DSM 11393]